MNYDDIAQLVNRYGEPILKIAEEYKYWLIGGVLYILYVLIKGGQ